MLSIPFPINHGFEYYENDDEFRLYIDHNEYFLVWEIKGKWEISHVDKEDNQKFLAKGDETKIVNVIRSLIRDRKIDLLFDTM